MVFYFFVGVRLLVLIDGLVSGLVCLDSVLLVEGFTISFVLVGVTFIFGGGWC